MTTTIFPATAIGRSYSLTEAPDCLDCDGEGCPRCERSGFEPCGYCGEPLDGLVVRESANVRADLTVVTHYHRGPCAAFSDAPPFEAWASTLGGAR